MGVSGMWKSNMVMLALMIFVNFLCMSFGTTAWLILGLLVLAGGMYLCVRQGLNMGREACAILKTVNHAQSPDAAPGEVLDKKYINQAWSVSRGVRGVFASALIPYLASCIYIILSLL